MIHFFRKIRQRLLTKNRFSKYLIYAIGEIVLVVIGILIALQINDWNESRKNRYKEDKLKIDLLSDFKETKIRLQETIKRQQQVIDYSRQLIISYDTKQLMSIKDSLPQFTGFGFSAWWRAEPVTKTYQSMISTGNIDLLNDDNLKQKLAEFHAELDSGFEDQEESMNLLNALNIQLAPYGFMLKQNFARKEIGITHLNDSLLRNIVSDKDVNKLQRDHALFNLAAKRMLLENNRLISQQKMEGFVDDILLILNKHD
jgi:hypothetical protein